MSSISRILQKPFTVLAGFRFFGDDGQRTVITEEQASRARYINSHEFFATPGNPFRSAKYQEIGFPLLVGQIEDEPELYNRMKSCAQANKAQWGFYSCVCSDDNIAERGLYTVRRPAIIDSPLCSHIQNTISQITRIDFSIYRQSRVRVLFSIQGSYLRMGRPQNSSRWHADLEYGGDVSGLFKSLRDRKSSNNLSAEYGVDSEAMPAIGLTRIYSFALGESASGTEVSCATEFRDMQRKILPRFHNRQIYHWIAEDHRSRRLWRNYFRVFFRAYITPMAE
jgi:hypothetical protein